MNAIIDATIVTGLGTAARTLKWQLPHLIKYFPEIANCHLGSINLQLDRPLRIANPDCTTPPIHWSPLDPTLFERFSFLRGGFEYPTGAPPQQAWLYIAHDARERLGLFAAEIIAPYIETVRPGERCRLHIIKKHKFTEIIVV
jgi:hypothetical protein